MEAGLGSRGPCSLRQALRAASFQPLWDLFVFVLWLHWVFIVFFFFFFFFARAFSNCSQLGILFRRRQWQATPVLLPRKSHGWRSLVGHSPWGRYESDTTERLHVHFSLSHNGEGNGNPLQCSCLENPRDGRAWWAAIYGVAQSQT